MSIFLIELILTGFEQFQSDVHHLNIPLKHESYCRLIKLLPLAYYLILHTVLDMLK